MHLSVCIFDKTDFVDLGQWLLLAGHRVSVHPPCGLYLVAVHNEFCIACIEVYVVTAAYLIQDAVLLVNGI